jgi:hypothetical protein
MEGKWRVNGAPPYLGVVFLHGGKRPDERRKQGESEAIRDVADAAEAVPVALNSDKIQLQIPSKQRLNIGSSGSLLGLGFNSALQCGGGGVNLPPRILRPRPR